MPELMILLYPLPTVAEPDSALILALDRSQPIRESLPKPEVSCAVASAAELLAPVVVFTRPSLSPLASQQQGVRGRFRHTRDEIT